jgi:DNA-binding SARP family transcriptional activator/Flp pilus assembly protein TadD
VEIDAKLELHVLGPLTVRRGGIAIPLPASRKARALLAYLALSPHPVNRARLCEMLWDVPNDPRGELRWCLSKLRRLLDEPRRRRVVTQGDALTIDLSDAFVDALDVAHDCANVDALGPDRLRELAQRFDGDLLEGLEMDQNPLFDGWLAAQRRRFRAYRIALLARLVRHVADDEQLTLLERWVQLAPFDLEAHRLLLGALARRHRIRDGEEHLAATVRLFEEEALDPTALREAWRSARAQRVEAAAAVPLQPDLVSPAGRRASVAVMPFADGSDAATARRGLAGALVHDVITRLAKLRSLFVIAQGTVFALHERLVGPEEAGRLLNVDYVAAGTVQTHATRIVVTVELVETRTARIIWAETFDRGTEDTFAVLDQIGDSIVASIANEIETSEKNRAILIPPSSLDAWEAHHRGLWHMYRFNKTDNDLAQRFFDLAVRLDPTFSRAYAGLSFTHFQNVFLGWADRDREVDLAYRAAAQSVLADDRDPAAHWAVGRALWLRGEHRESVKELQTSVGLSPNFALGHYTIAFVESQTGDPNVAIAAADHSRQLSPFDPLLFGMFGARAMALLRLGRFDEAAEWAIKAAARPNAHAHISAIAAYALTLSGRDPDARAYLAAVRRMLPAYSVDDFLAAMQFAPGDQRLFREAAKRLAS